MKRTIFLLGLLMAGVGLSLSACTPKPKMAAQDFTIPTAGSLPSGEFPGRRPHFGHFNLQKRHGLGGWEGATPALSEREWARHLSASTQRLSRLGHTVKL